MKAFLSQTVHRRIKTGTIIFAWLCWLLALLMFSWISWAFIVFGFIPYLIQNQIPRREMDDDPPDRN